MSKLLVPGDTAPQIQSQAVQRGDIVDMTLDDALKEVDYLLLVFYPADFTFVCPTEIVQFMEKHGEFAKQQCSVVCCSTDSVYTHLAWLKAPKSERGLGATNSSPIVLLSDRSHEISRAYGVLASNGAAYRGTFLIDKKKTICQVTINDMPVGRSVDEALRMLTELRGRADGHPADACKQQSNSSNAQHFSEFSAHLQKQLPRRHRSNQFQKLQHRVLLRPPAGPPNDVAPVPTPTGLVTRAAQLEKQAARLRLRDSQSRLSAVQAEADRLRAEAARQRTDTERLKAEARVKQVELARLLRGRPQPAQGGAGAANSGGAAGERQSAAAFLAAS